jgi:hypothetical protein
MTLSMSCHHFSRDQKGAQLPNPLLGCCLQLLQVAVPYKAANHLLDAIDVTFPYCKLTDVRQIDPATIQAHFPIEQIVKGDKGQSNASTAELARHMAIAGKCESKFVGHWLVF